MATYDMTSSDTAGVGANVLAVPTVVGNTVRTIEAILDIDAMMTTFDTNADGVISLDEFLAEMEEKQSFIPKLPELAPPPKKK